jgi:plasmid stabilization system protein ParE
VSYALIIRPEAEQDMAEGRDWYEGQREGLGDEFLTTVEEVFDRINEMPELHASEYKAVRRAGVSRFPYVVYYRIVGESVEVLAVQHGGRDPRRWRSRA